MSVEMIRWAQLVKQMWRMRRRQEPVYDGDPYTSWAERSRRWLNRQPVDEVAALPEVRRNPRAREVRMR